MADVRGFCAAVMHEYERQWGRGGGHAVLHPLRLKMERLKLWGQQPWSPDEFERRLEQASASEDPGEALLADELLPLWRALRVTGKMPFAAAAPPSPEPPAAR